MTREPPPCIWFMKTKKSRKMTMNGSQPSSTFSREFPCGFLTSYDGAALLQRPGDLVVLVADPGRLEVTAAPWW